MSPIKQQSNSVIPTESEYFTNQKSQKDKCGPQIMESTLYELENELNSLDLPKTTFIHSITFFLLGIASLAGWNVILSAILFYHNQFKQVTKNPFDVYNLFPIPIMLTNFIAGLACPWFSKIFSYNIRICGGLIATCLTLLSTAFIALYWNTFTGFLFILAILFIQGFVDSVATNSLVDLAGMMDKNINSIYWTCTALSGLIMNIIRIGAYIAFQETTEGSISNISYFAVAISLIVIASLLQVKLTQSDYFYLIQKRDEIKQRIQIISSKESVIECSEKVGFCLYINYIRQVFKYAGAIPVFLCIIYIQTFIVFPKASVIYRKPDQIPEQLIQIMYFTIYNFGDMIGKFIGGLKCLQKLYLTYAIVILRFLMMIFFILIAYEKGGKLIQSDAFGIVLMLLFSISNGYSTSSLMVQGTKNVKHPSISRLINFFGGFAITFGISIGSIIAYGINKPQS